MDRNASIEDQTMPISRIGCQLSVFPWPCAAIGGLILLWCVSACASADDFIIRNARVFDGKKSLEPTDVWVQAGKIKAIGKQLQAPAEIQSIDATGNMLLPGLIDAHTHTYGDALKEAIIFGVTTELDMFSDPHFVRQVKKLEGDGNNPAADLRSAGTLATAPGGHGTQFGFAIPTLAAPEESGAWVDARIKEGSDYIKIVYDDCRQYGFERPTLTKETMKAVIDAAHARGKLAVVHIGTERQARDAIEAGADGLAHLFADNAPSPDFAAFVAKHNVFVIPTLTVLEGISGRPGGESLAADARLEPFLTSPQIANLRKAFPLAVPLEEKHAEKAVRALHSAGVPILAGTDAPNPGTAHGASIHRELELLVRAGLTPAEALASASSVPAKAFQLADRGEIAAGKRADLVLVKGDATRDITAARDIISVWKAGVLIDRDAYRDKIRSDKQAAEKARMAAVAGAGDHGPIADFEDNKTSAKFGAGWSYSTDSIAGGKSTGKMETVAGGANKSKHSLRVAGTIHGALPYAWSGVMFSPGAQVFAPANLSGKKDLTFWAKGDGKTYRAMIFTARGGRIPAQQPFASKGEWQQYRIPLSSFGTDGHDIAAILFVGGPAAGAFEFWLDDIALK
jgi:imidazolonepropionase-like amidohydrolase